MGRPRGSTRAGGVRSLERGLSLLVAMNRRTLASVAELATDTGLPRPTVYRLLDTLCEAGFVGHDAARDGYRLTRGVRALSDGFLDDEWVSEIAGPLMLDFTREHVWPVSIFTFEAGRMLVRDTTHRASALSIDYGMVGKRMPMLQTAAGLVYLAFSPENERRAILDLLARSDAPEDRQAREGRRLDALLEGIHSKGYATQERAINPKASSISVPILVGSKVFGAISLIWISSAVSMSEAEKRLLPPLRAMAAKLAGALAKGHSRNGELAVGALAHLTQADARGPRPRPANGDANGDLARSAGK